MTFVVLGGVQRNLHVCEHAFHFLRKLISAFNFEFRKHASLGVVRDGSTCKKAFGQVGLVVTFKGVLVRDKSEEGDGAIENGFDLVIGFLGE